MSDDLIDHYTKSGLISDPTKNFRPCDGCGRRCHPDDLMTRDVENYGGHETIELCERCDTPPEPVGIEGINFDALNLDANVKEHAPLSAGASVDHGVEVETTEKHENKAADRGCCVSTCSPASFMWADSMDLLYWRIGGGW